MLKGQAAGDFEEEGPSVLTDLGLLKRWAGWIKPAII
jgi:hypothetical protein